jgi:putative sigma-54 modulation protein
MKRDVTMFKYSFSGKNYNITDNLKERTRSKIGRLEKLLPYDVDVNIKFGVNRQDHRIEVTIPLRRRMLRAEVTATDMLTALDQIVDVLEKQLIKYKNRIRDRYRKDASYKDELSLESISLDDGPINENPVTIDRTKHFPLKPMDAEEAVMEMEMLGHNFYMFRNGHTDLVNVVYKRENGSYGLIEPEY